MVTTFFTHGFTGFTRGHSGFGHGRLFSLCTKPQTGANWRTKHGRLCDRLAVITCFHTGNTHHKGEDGGPRRKLPLAFALPFLGSEDVREAAADVAHED